MLINNIYERSCVILKAKFFTLSEIIHPYLHLLLIVLKYKLIICVF